jgi:CxxC motif-containing protein (DUF1111 family)
MLIRLWFRPRPKRKGKIASHRANAIPDPTYGGQLQTARSRHREGKLKINTRNEVKLDGEIVVARSDLHADRPRLDLCTPAS